MSDAKRLKALLSIIEKIQAGKHVQNRTLQTHLTVEEYEEYLSERKQQKSLRVDIKDKPAEVVNIVVATFEVLNHFFIFRP